MENIFCSHQLSMNLRIRMIRCYVFTVLFYGLETWPLSKVSINRIKAFELWIYRKILKISWCDHITNVTVLERMNKNLELVTTIKTRKLQYLGHFMRHPEKYSLLQLIIQSKIAGRRSHRRTQISWMDNLRKWFNTSTISLFRTAVNRDQIANMIANVQ